jgi:hypothetical protein
MQIVLVGLVFAVFVAGPVVAALLPQRELEDSASAQGHEGRAVPASSPLKAA